MARRIAMVSLALLVTSTIQAHDIGLSSAMVQLHTNRLETLLTFAVREIEEMLPLDTDQDGAVSPEEFAGQQEVLTAMLVTNCAVIYDYTAAPLDRATCRLDGSNNVELQFSCAQPVFKHLELQYPIIQQLTPGHRMLFTLLSPEGEVLSERLLSQNSPVVSIQMDPPPQTEAAVTPAAAPPPTFIEFVKLGLEHILTGYDHLLFLFALLIVTRDFMAAFKVVTCFTVAHSITLGVATFDLLHLPSSLVEPLIAATIVYVGLENVLRQGDPRGRWLLTFGFGLIHGFGFASVLRELGVGVHMGVALPLFSFNLGVELGQIAVAALALPLIWHLRKKEFVLRRGVPACSLAVVLLGAVWFVQRIWR